MMDRLAIPLVFSYLLLWPYPIKSEEELIGYWSPHVKTAIELHLKKYAEKGAYVILDFDNTLMCHDIGEAAFAQLLMDGRINRDSITPTLRPLPCEEPEENLYSYYQRLCRKNNRLGYQWIVQIMHGLRVSDVIDATEQACQWESPFEYWHDNTRCFVRSPKPYVEMQSLVSCCHSLGIQTFVVSASNIFSVRWSAQRHFGIPGSDVIAIAPYVSDGNQCLNPQKLDNCDSIINGILTPLLNSPVPCFQGKVDAITAYIKRRNPPLLIAGDSGNDWPMMTHFTSDKTLRLWINKNRADTSKIISHIIQRPDSHCWLFQKADTELGRFVK